MLALIALRDPGVKHVYVKAGSGAHVRIAEALGATETIFPERESALAFASPRHRASSCSTCSWAANLSQQEMAVPPPGWAGRSRELGLPQRHRVQVVGGARRAARQDSCRSPSPTGSSPSPTRLAGGREPQALLKLAALR
jgi:trk system potassium uptake protein TrkA